MVKRCRCRWGWLFERTQTWPFLTWVAELERSVISENRKSSGSPKTLYSQTLNITWFDAFTVPRKYKILSSRLFWLPVPPWRLFDNPIALEALWNSFSLSPWSRERWNVSHSRARSRDSSFSVLNITLCKFVVDCEPRTLDRFMMSTLCSLSLHK